MNADVCVSIPYIPCIPYIESLKLCVFARVAHDSFIVIFTYIIIMALISVVLLALVACRVPLLLLLAMA